jgi:cyclopropane fatty-acyl-phospholipid synthase-like methyltransferase
MAKDPVAASWDAEYARRKYADDPPLPLVRDILATATRLGLSGQRALDIGCGNGRNYVALVKGGLDVTGLDVSQTALSQLEAKMPGRRDRLILGDLTALPPGELYSIVIAIQVLQHGNRKTCHEHVRTAQAKVAAGGLFCLRVNAVGTEFDLPYERTEENPDGGFTVRYLGGPKKGLEIHFFSEAELRSLFDGGFTPVISVRPVRMPREPPGKGQWTQWEAIWRKGG